ncbi:tyrosine-type recombinase/integrase [Streptomyces hawaiiensis]|uniref:tyrosine-type recombinase/integrase n=1 Tax=Streptomyces hawaiiensis TaxID=67305 RepID=UPI0036670230
MGPASASRRVCSSSCGAPVPACPGRSTHFGNRTGDGPHSPVGQSLLVRDDGGARPDEGEQPGRGHPHPATSLRAVGAEQAAHRRALWGPLRPRAPVEGAQEPCPVPLVPKEPDGTVAITYSIFGNAFRDRLEALDIGTWVLHQVRHPLATNLLKNGAGLHRIKQYLGQTSVRMAEHYAKVASSEVDDALERVWVSGPGSAEPGPLLASPAEHMTRAEAQAMAIDLSRRSTPAEGGFCTYQPVVRGDACPWNLDCHNCD